MSSPQDHSLLTALALAASPPVFGILPKAGSYILMLISAERNERTIAAFWRACCADGAAVVDQPVAEHEPFRLRNQGGKLLFYLDGVFGVAEPEPVAEPDTMRIGHNAGIVENGAEYQVRRLAAYAG